MLVTAAAGVLLTGCGVPSGGDRGPRTDGLDQAPVDASVLPPDTVTGTSGATSTPGSTVAGTVGGADAGAPPQVAAPGAVQTPLHSADLLVYSDSSFTSDDLADLRATRGVTDVLAMSLAQTALQDRMVTIAAVDPGEYRRWTPHGSATLQEAWERVAAGEMAVSESIDTQFTDDRGYLALGGGVATDVHVGARMLQVPRIDLMVNQAWGPRLGMREQNAVLLSTGLTSPQKVRDALRRRLGSGASVQVLGPDLDTSAVQTAVLTAGSVRDAVGSFTYTVLGGGRVAPDPAWVRANIRTETVPILGTVTCHRAMLPQLRSALTEVVQRGLADKVHPGEYAGCYYPRFIANTTSLSNHSFGTALDINVPGNQRGTSGEIDRTVVQIFKKWGFAWGGDWNWTDPMHFELARIVTPG